MSESAALGATLARPHIWVPAAASIETARTLLLLHGTGADEHDLVNLGKALDPKANLLSVRGLVVAHGMARHFMRFDDGTFDESGILRNSNELAHFLSLAAEHYGFDPSKVWAVGFSNGATASIATLIQRPETLAGAIAFATTRSFEGWQPAPDLSEKRVFIANGDQDSYSPPAQTEELVSELRSWGADVTVMSHAGGHSIALEHVKQISSILA
jgi:phospholipase/carboxylesterase